MAFEPVTTRRTYFLCLRRLYSSLCSVFSVFLCCTKWLEEERERERRYCFSDFRTNEDKAKPKPKRAQATRKNAISVTGIAANLAAFPIRPKINVESLRAITATHAM